MKMIAKRRIAVIASILLLLAGVILAQDSQRSSSAGTKTRTGSSEANTAGAETGALISMLSFMLVFIILLNPCVYGSGSPPACNMDFIAIPQDVTVRYFNIMFLKMLIPWFILIFILLGIYLIFMQGSPSGRSEAKAMFIDMMVGLLLVSFSPMILQTILDISHGISWEMFLKVDANVLSSWFATKKVGVCMLCCFELIFLVLLVLSMVISLIRYLAVLICAILWPLALFLYSFSYTKGLGNVLMKFTFLAIFSQIFQTFFMVAVMALTPGSGDSLLGMFTVAAGLGLMILSPLYAMKFLGWIGGVMWMFSTRGGLQATRTLGAMAMGQSPGEAMVTATSRWSIRQMGGPYGPMGGRLPMWQQPFSNQDASGTGKVIGEDYPQDKFSDPRLYRQPEGMEGGFFGATGSSLAGAGFVGGGSAWSAGLGGVQNAAPARPATPATTGRAVARRAPPPIPTRRGTTQMTGGAVSRGTAGETTAGYFGTGSGGGGVGESAKSGEGGESAAEDRARRSLLSDTGRGLLSSARAGGGARAAGKASSAGEGGPELKSDKVKALEAEVAGLELAKKMAQKEGPKEGAPPKKRPKRPPTASEAAQQARRRTGGRRPSSENERPPVTKGDYDARDPKAWEPTETQEGPVEESPKEKPPAAKHPSETQPPRAEPPKKEPKDESGKKEKPAPKRKSK